MNITKLIIDNQISKMEKDSIIILDNKEQVLDTIYLYDQIEDKKQTGKEMESQLTTKDALHSLNKRQQHILDERFVIGKTQMEIAEELSISQAQVSRLEKSAIKKLKKILK